MKKCKKCGNRFFKHVMVSDYCTTCLEKYPKLQKKQEQAAQQKLTENFSKIGKIQFPQLCEGKETVVLLAEGDGGLQLAVKCAEDMGYELMNTSSAMSMWTPLTKHTLIFKKKRD